MFNTSNLFFFKNGITAIRTVIDCTVVVLSQQATIERNGEKYVTRTVHSPRQRNVLVHMYIGIYVFMYVYMGHGLCRENDRASHESDPKGATRPRRSRCRDRRQREILLRSSTDCDERCIFYLFFLFLILPLPVLLCLNRLRGRVVSNRIRLRRLIWKGKFRRRHRATLYTG